MSFSQGRARRGQHGEKKERRKSNVNNTSNDNIMKKSGMFDRLKKVGGRRE